MTPFRMNPRDTTSHIRPCEKCLGTGTVYEDIDNAAPCTECDTMGTQQHAGSFIAYELVRNQQAGEDVPAYLRKEAHR